MLVLNNVSTRKDFVFFILLINKKKVFQVFLLEVFHVKSNIFINIHFQCFLISSIFVKLKIFCIVEFSPFFFFFGGRRLSITMHLWILLFIQCIAIPYHHLHKSFMHKFGGLKQHKFVVSHSGGHNSEIKVSPRPCSL